MEDDDVTSAVGEVCHDDWPTMVPTDTNECPRRWIRRGRSPTRAIEGGERLLVPLDMDECSATEDGDGTTIGDRGKIRPIRRGPESGLGKVRRLRERPKSNVMGADTCLDKVGLGTVAEGRAITWGEGGVGGGVVSRSHLGASGFGAKVIVVGKESAPSCSSSKGANRRLESIETDETVESSSSSSCSDS